MQGQQGQVPIDINETEPIKCECGGEIFQDAFMLRKLSALNPRSMGKEQIIPMPVMLCLACGKILQ